MYKKILVALENSRADDSLLPHVAQLASILKSEVVLIHVADGFAARHYENLKLAESDEMKADREYLQRHAEALRAKGSDRGRAARPGKPADRDPQSRRTRAVRPHRDDHARPPILW